MGSRTYTAEQESVIAQLHRVISDRLDDAGRLDLQRATRARS